MAKASAVAGRGTVQRYADSMTLLTQPGEYVVVERGVPRSLVMKCPDGCGDLLTVNLDARTGPAWRVFTRRGRLTIYPSVWRETGCRAHFIVWNDQILWCDADETTAWDDSELIATVREQLPAAGTPHRHFEDIAVALGAVPWETLWACRALVRSGVAESSSKGTKFGIARASDRRRGRLSVKA